MKLDMIVILDLGGTDSTGIAREIRRLGVYSEIHPHDISAETLKAMGNVKGIVLNGGPNNIIDGQAIDCGTHVYQSGLPVLTVAHETPHRAMDLPLWPSTAEQLETVLGRFIFDVCQAEKGWTMDRFIDDQIELVRQQVGDKKVLLALSGGVDSSVVAALLVKAIGQQLVCVHVNHGLLRKDEPEQVVSVFGEKIGANLIYVDASDRFLDKLAGVEDPEQKRKIIGEEFIRVFEEEAKKLDDIAFLAQGTIYPDIIESGTKTAKPIKAHHNVGGLPEDLKFELVEPLKQLFKDEVRQCGVALGLPAEMVYRQPFPGPGLGVRCLGAITRDRLHALRESDAILRETFKEFGLEDKVWQYFTVVPNVRSVGVRNDARSYEYPVIIRAVNTVDAMTATVPRLDYDMLEAVTNRILANVPGVNRVCLDLSPKPPATIEWE